MFLDCRFLYVIKSQSSGLPAEMWSPTGQRLHHIIGLLPGYPTGLLVLMSFHTKRHLTCLPTLWAELIYTAQQERGMRILLVGVVV